MSLWQHPARALRLMAVVVRVMVAVVVRVMQWL